MVVVHGQADLLEIVGALGPAGCLPCRLHSRKEQGDQDRDNCNDDEQFDQCKAATRFPFIEAFLSELGPLEKVGVGRSPAYEGRKTREDVPRAE